jgi:subtilisin-like proprotein convertase family protein
MHTSRSIARVGVLALVAGAVAAGGSSPASAATATYHQPAALAIGQSAATAGGAAVTIKDLGPATPYPSTASVAGVVGVVTDVNVTLLGLTHANPDDMDVMLVSPAGKRAIVLSDAGGDTDASGVDVRLDDQATQGLPDATALAAGAYRPADHEVGDPFPAPAPDASGAGSALSVFNDGNPNGTWSLYVVDDGNGHTGSLASWRLDVTTTGPVPYPSTLAVSGAADRITDVNVLLNGVTHTSPSDIDLLLVGPGGQQATIMSDVGSDSDVSGVHLVLDDEATTPITTPVVAGAFMPTNAGGVDALPATAPTASGASSLTAFDGTNPNGTWSLYASDDATGDTGALTSGWSIQITAIDTIAPAVATTKPTAGKRGVGRNADVKATFTEKVRPLTVNRSTFYLVRAGTTTRIRASVSYDVATMKATLDPRGALQPRTRYRAVVTTYVKDLAGKRLDQNSTLAGRQSKSWTFRTR